MWHVERVTIAYEELRVRDENAIRQEVAEPGLRPSVDDELRDEMEIGAWVDVVGDARRDDREDARGALAAEIEPREEPVFTTDHEPPELALAPRASALRSPSRRARADRWPRTRRARASAARRRCPRAKRVHCLSMGMCSSYLSATASTSSVSPRRRRDGRPAGRDETRRARSPSGCRFPCGRQRPASRRRVARSAAGSARRRGIESVDEATQQ